VLRATESEVIGNSLIATICRRSRATIGSVVVVTAKARAQLLALASDLQLGFQDQIPKSSMRKNGDGDVRSDCDRTVVGDRRIARAKYRQKPSLRKPAQMVRHEELLS
jgi:hypothetical protein